MIAAPGPLVIFDIGNTLVRGPDRGPAARLTAGLGLDHDTGLAELLMTTDFADADALAVALETRYGLPPGSARMVAHRIWTSQTEDAHPIEGTLDTLHSLSAAGVRLALLSNIWRPYFESVRRWFGPVLDATIPRELQCLSYRLGCVKPAPELFTRLLARAATPPDRAVMVGDSVARDMAPAARLGLSTVLVGGTVPDGAKDVVDTVCASVAELTVEAVSDLVAQARPAAEPDRTRRVLR